MYPPRCTDADCTDALRTTGGNVSAAARMLGYPDPTNLHRRIARRPSLWPEGVPRLAPGGVPRVTDAAVVAALAAMGGNQTAAARMLGMSQSGMWKRASLIADRETGNLLP
jgi:transcriptional regulator of acetoin/glycerol metabolism